MTARRSTVTAPSHRGSPAGLPTTSRYGPGSADHVAGIGEPATARGSSGGRRPAVGSAGDSARQRASPVVEDVMMSPCAKSPGGMPGWWLSERECGAVTPRASRETMR